MDKISFNIEGYSFDIDADNPYYREQCCREIYNQTGKTYFWMHEETGKKHWVLYNPNEFYAAQDSEHRCEYLHLSSHFAGKIHLPINASSCCCMFSALDLAKLDFTEMDTSQIIDMSEMFSSCKLGKTFIPKFSTGNVITMRRMLANCNGTEEIDLSYLDVKNVIDFSQMLKECLDLEKINFTSWRTESAENFNGMFDSCYKIIGLDLSHFITNNLKDIGSMLVDCFSLEWINFSGWNFSKVVDISKLFCHCGNLIEITITAGSNSTKELKYALQMFDGCESLATVNLSWLDFSQVIDVSNLFEGCLLLEELDLSKINANIVKHADCAFKGCSSLTKLNLMGLKMGNLISGWYMFENCYNLKEILVKDFPNKLSDEQKNSMFEEAGVCCFTLVAEA